MSLLWDKSVIVIGAGASVPFGAPDGLTLMDKIEATLRANARGLEAYQRTAPYSHNFATESPIYWAWQSGGASYETYPHIAAEVFDDLARWLSKQTSDSIDDVIRHNPKYAEKLKICIVFELLKVTHSKNGNGCYTPREFGVRLFDEKRNWIHRLINVGRAALIEAKENQWQIDCKVRIVSFNYDGILEHVLSEKWDDVEGEFGNWADVFSIYHPHGLIPISKEPIRSDQLVQYLKDSAARIAVVHDTAVSESIANNRTEAKKLCSRAIDIYAFGFAFAPSNCRLLGWDEPLLVDPDDVLELHNPTVRKINYVNYDGSNGLRRRVEQTFFPRLEIIDYAPEVPASYQIEPIVPLPGQKYVEITDALFSGFLGEMPA
jgi:hypothetical protein